MPATKGATGLSLALAKAASRVHPGPHLPGKMTLALIVIVLLVLWFVLYRVSLWLHPFTMCRRCGGSGKVSGFFGWTRAFCGKCGGSGLVPRLGTYLGDMRGQRARASR
jgi:hypothetical protein